MTSGKTKVSTASLKVLEGWGIDTIYGIPSGTLAPLMESLGEQKDTDIKFVQVKHEEVGAMAAVMQRKFGGKMAVCVGSGGPGASHLINGLYDAAMDNTPVLAILGSRPQKELNMDAFQELNQNPMFASIAVYNRRVAYAEQLPKMIDDAIRTAISKRGVSVIEVPGDFGYHEIDSDAFYSSGHSYRDYVSPALNETDIDAAVELLNGAKRPAIYAGVGTMGHGPAVQELSRKLKAPVITTGKNFETFEYDFEALTGSTYRVGWKPANETVKEADTILFVGSNFPFAEIENTFSNTEKFIQIDNNPTMLGKRHNADVAILGDAGEAVKSLLDKVAAVPESAWWNANLKNIQNWRDYMTKLETKEAGALQLYQVYNAINKYADEDAIYSIDVGNSTQTSIRHLHMTPKNMWRTSPLFATMGIGLPGGIGAKNVYPDRQVFNIMGDGAFSMNYQDIITNVRYNMPVINIVFTNTEYAFIKNKYEDTNTNTFGTDFTDVDYAKIGEAQGAVGFTVSRIEDIDQVMADAVKAYKEGNTVVIDAKITKDRPIPVETLKLDPALYSAEDIKNYKEKYEAEELIPLSEFLKAEGLESKVAK
ncbi:MAG: pyruvate oxidase [Alkalibacterium sp.]|uniref:pyruvate oxidase n=1 Tax=Alkalibacterium TaxID=99906 RepID=UPI002647CC82|nr:pyruvate oxidase [Alkalibacterium sp.]MDN6296309.1 pyruvate oxidase [Alkalibacterium sp.]MDN6385851.1 pyruvate oxidase [Alkalibacterium sp.]MDN6398699.1 pyruvate oxidase [Alkalibacterium sp.]